MKLKYSQGHIKLGPFKIEEPVIESEFIKGGYIDIETSQREFALRNLDRMADYVYTLKGTALIKNIY